MCTIFAQTAAFTATISYTYSCIHAIAGDESRSYVESAIGEWIDKTCVQFKEKTDEDDDFMEFIYEVGYVRLCCI